MLSISALLTVLALWPQTPEAPERPAPVPASPTPVEARTPASAPANPTQESEAEPAPAIPSRIALIGATVHDFAEGAEPYRATILIEDERIAAIGPDLELEPGTRRFPAEGLHVTPGLIDGLASLDPDHDALYIAHGVTTVRDPGGDLPLLEVMLDPRIRNAVPGPHLITAGVVFDGDPPASAVAVVVQSPDAVEPLVEILDQRIDPSFLNAQPGLGEDELRVLCEAAAARNLEVWSEGSRGVPFERLLELGQRGFFGLSCLLPAGVEWSFVLPTAFRARVALAAESGAMFMPMLGSNERLIKAPVPSERIGLLSPDYEALYLAELRAREKAQADEQFLPTASRIRDKLSRLVQDLDEAGVLLVPASSAPLGGAFPGASMIEELEAWMVAGFTREQVLRAATRTAARVFGLRERGAIEVGKIADLVVLDRDPRETLDGFRDPAAVVVRGRLLDRVILKDLLETVRLQQGEVREQLAQPIEIDPPSIPEDGALLMSGQVETKSLGSRISSEAWTAFRTPDGALHLRGRLVAPAQGRMAGLQMEIEQIVVEGLLQAFALQAKSGEDLLQVEGVYDAARFRIRREFNGEPVDTRSMVARPGAINLSAVGDSVTTAFVIGQRKTDGPMTVLTFGEFFEPVEQRWQVDTGVGAERLLRTAQGAMTLRYGRDGRLIEWGRIAGQAVTVTRPISFSTWGGGGLPVAFELGDVPEGVDPGSTAPDVSPPRMPDNTTPQEPSEGGSGDGSVPAGGPTPKGAGPADGEQ